MIGGVAPSLGIDWLAAGAGDAGCDEVAEAFGVASGRWAYTIRVRLVEVVIGAMGLCCDENGIDGRAVAGLVEVL
jgi:hypothetical protein